MAEKTSIREINFAEDVKLGKTKFDSKGGSVLGILEGPIADAEHATRNGRTYTTELWDEVFNSPLVQEQFDNGGVLGEVDHPADRDEVLLSQAAIKLTDKPTKDKDGLLHGRFEILNTPQGQIVYNLARSGCSLGVSSRGTGEVDPYTNEVDPRTFDFDCFDVVYMPAVKSARVDLVSEGYGSKTHPIANPSYRNYNKFCKLMNESISKTDNIETKKILTKKYNIVKQKLYENLDAPQEWQDFLANNQDKDINPKFDWEKYGKYFDKNGKLVDKTGYDNAISELIKPARLIDKDTLNEIEESTIDEDTKKKKNGNWVNKGKEGEHGEFKTKKEADAQRKAMFANGYKGESMTKDNKITGPVLSHKKSINEAKDDEDSTKQPPVDDEPKTKENPKEDTPKDETPECIKEFNAKLISFLHKFSGEDVKYEEEDENRFVDLFSTTFPEIIDFISANCEDKQESGEENAPDSVDNAEDDDALLTQLSQAIDENAELKTKLEQIQGEKAAINDRVKTLEDESNLYKSTSASLTKRVGELRKENLELIHKNNSLRENFGKTPDRTKEVNSLKEQINALKESSISKEQLNQTKSSLEEEIQKEKKKLTQCKEELDKTKSKYIEKTARSIGATAREITNKLPNDYTIDDIDKVAETIEEEYIRFGGRTTRSQNISAPRGKQVQIESKSRTPIVTYNKDDETLANLQEAMIRLSQDK